MGIPRLSADQAKKLLGHLPNWRLLPDARAIQAEYRFENFREAAGGVQKIVRLAEAANHHPDLHLTRYRFLKIVLTTHAVHGLSAKDFALAGKIQRSFSR